MKGLQNLMLNHQHKERKKSHTSKVYDKDLKGLPNVNKIHKERHYRQDTQRHHSNTKGLPNVMPNCQNKSLVNHEHSANHFVRNI